MKIYTHGTKNVGHYTKKVISHFHLIEVILYSFFYFPIVLHCLTPHRVLNMTLKIIDLENKMGCALRKQVKLSHKLVKKQS